MRKLATLRKISDLQPIPGADLIEVASVDGWKVVVKKGDFQVGQFALYLEIDSWVPTELAPFLSKGQEPRMYEGVRGERLRTAKLRGQISQGLLLDIGTADNPKLPQIWQYLWDHNMDDTSPYDADFSELLGIKKWEAPIPAELAGQVKGIFPSWMRKTDQERCQNLINEIFIDNAEAQYEVTLKLDGTSCTFYARDGEVGVCSRNLELKVNEENKDNTLVRMLIDSGLKDIFESGVLAKNVAIQGELMGPGIQKNRENLKTHTFYIFDVQLLDENRYMTPIERLDFFMELCKAGIDTQRVYHIPIIAHSANLYNTLGIKNVEELLKFADGPSLNHQVREGLVFKRIDGGFSFKAISNTFLAKEKD